MQSVNWNYFLYNPGIPYCSSFKVTLKYSLKSLFSFLRWGGRHYLSDEDEEEDEIEEI